MMKLGRNAGKVLQKDGNCRYKVLKCTGNSKMVSTAGVKLEVELY